VWQVDTAWLEGSSTFSQIIRIWAFGGSQFLKAMNSKVAAVHKTYSAEKIKRCNLRKIGREGRSVIPVLFDNDDCGDSTTLDSKAISEEEALVMHDMVVTLKVRNTEDDSSTWKMDLHDIHSLSFLA
jgi:hypothetical protein